jgi:hypothetical protein
MSAKEGGAAGRLFLFRFAAATMSIMRCATLIVLIPLTAAAAAGPDPLELARRFAAAGAPHLALARVEQLQPANLTAPNWSEWETLRCALLDETGRHADLVRRVAALPAAAAEKVKRSCLEHGASAALAVNDNISARDFLARLIWRHGPSPEEIKRWRRSVIDSYANEGRPQDAYALMLRYQQDYRPVDSETAAHFVDALLVAGMDKEALGWLASLDESSPAKVLLRLANNLMTADAAVAQLRAPLAKSAHPAASWQALRQAALRAKNASLEIEALEQLLQLADVRASAQVTEWTAALWKAYGAAAQDIANQNHILAGDEAALSDIASRRLATAPSAGRAVFAHLVQQSANTDTRLAAQLQLVHSLAGAKLPQTALRLFADAGRFPAGQIDNQARYLLGAIARDRNQPALAVRFWKGLDAPPMLSAGEWHVQFADVLARVRALDDAADVLRRLIAGKSALPADVTRQAIAATQMLQDAGRQKAADELYRGMLEFALPPEKREILMRLGGMAEGGGDFARAADCFLEAALVVDQNAGDGPAWNARFQAALNLERAGLKEDANAQFDWLRKHARDAVQQELVRREPGKR